MKFAISNIAWDENEDKEVYALMREYGFEGLEIAPTRIFKNPYEQSLDTLIQFRKSIENNEKLKLVSMQSLIYSRPDLTLFGSIEKRDELKEYIKKAINFASILGIGNLVFGSPKNRIIKDYSAQYDIAIDFFREIGNYASEKGTVVSIEPNPKEYGTNFINTTKEAIQLVESVNSNGFRLQIDTGTIQINNEEFQVVSEGIEYINHIHISEPYLDKINKGKKDFYLELLETLKEINYDKSISIEMKKNSISDIKDAMKIVNELRNYL
jgi:sugar phosphate isomerase/epimerase